MKPSTAVIIAVALVVPVSIAQWHIWPMSSSVFYALFPGNVVHLLITGGHGGTRAQEAVAPYVGCVTNIAAYSIVIFISARIGKSAKRA
jgi:hypothetical protein